MNRILHPAPDCPHSCRVRQRAFAGVYFGSAAGLSDCAAEGSEDQRRFLHGAAGEPEQVSLRVYVSTSVFLAPAHTAPALLCICSLSSPIALPMSLLAHSLTHAQTQSLPRFQSPSLTSEQTHSLPLSQSHARFRALQTHSLTRLTNTTPCALAPSRAAQVIWRHLQKSGVPTRRYPFGLVIVRPEPAGGVCASLLNLLSEVWEPGAPPPGGGV